MEPSNARPGYGLSVNSTARPRSVLVVAAALFVSSSVRGQSGVILHEYIPPDVIEDLRLGVLTPSGKMPAVVRTSSGLVSAPDKLRSPSEGPTPEYGATASRSASKFRIDGTTNDPGTLHYHEPFRPSIAPFKRLNTFDAVNDAFELYLHDSTREAEELATDRALAERPDLAQTEKEALRMERLQLEEERTNHVLRHLRTHQREEITRFNFFCRIKIHARDIMHTGKNRFRRREVALGGIHDVHRTKIK